MEDDLPALQLGQTAEGWHAAIRVAIRDFPKESAIRLLLDGRQVEISGLLQASPLVTVAFCAVTTKKFLSPGCGIRMIAKRVRFRGRFGWRLPFRVLMVRSTLGMSECGRRQNETRHQRMAHECPPNKRATFCPKPWIS
jgi:hypothetical protein